MPSSFTNSGLLGLGDVDLLLTQVNTDLLKRPIAPSNVVSLMAWRRPGSAPAGHRVVFPLPFFGNAWKQRSTYEEVEGTLPTFAKFALTTQLWAPDAEIIPALTQVSDLYGIVKEKSATMIAQGEVEVERQFASFIADGVNTPTDYDQLSFFNTAHECNPSNPGLKTFSNYKTARDLAQPGITQTLNDLAQMPGPDGNLLSMPGEVILFCSTESQYYVAELYANGTMVPSAAGTAPTSNPLKGRFVPVLIPALANYGNGKYWGMAKMPNEQHRPFTFSNPVPMQIGIEGLAINDHLQVTRAASKQKVQSVHGFGYLWPHLVVLCVEN